MSTFISNTLYIKVDLYQYNLIGIPMEKQVNTAQVLNYTDINARIILKH